MRCAKKNRENLFPISCICVCSHKVVAPHCRYHAKSIFSSFERIYCFRIPNKVYDATQHKGSAQDHIKKRLMKQTQHSEFLCATLVSTLDVFTMITSFLNITFIIALIWLSQTSQSLIAPNKLQYMQTTRRRVIINAN